jgi:hypothetical protein
MNLSQADQTRTWEPRRIKMKKKAMCFGFMMLFMLVIHPSVFAAEVENVIGIGLGLPYGGFGINYELGISDYFAPTFGVGYLPDNLGWNVGARLYYPDRSAKIRGRVTVLYGTNLLIERRNWSGGEEYETDEGISAGVGFNWQFSQNWAFDGDLFYTDYEIPEGYEEKGGSEVKFSLGFSSRW